MTIWMDLLGAEVRFIGDQGRRTRVLTAGSGVPLLLLHGQGGSLENFRHNFAAYAEHYRVVAFDFWWHGLSDRPPLSGPLVPRLIEQTKEVIELLELAPLHIEGQSQGGWVAASIALESPELLRKLVLTTPTGLVPTLEAVDAEALAKQLASQLEILDDPTDDAVHRRMAMLVADPAVIDGEQFALRAHFLRDPATNRGMRAAAQAYLSPANWSLRLGPADLAKLAMPTLLYWGAKNFGGRRMGDALSKVIPGAHYHCPDVGHWAQFELPAEHNRVVLDFLGG